MSSRTASTSRRAARCSRSSSASTSPTSSSGIGSPPERFVDDGDKLERWKLFRSLAEERTVRELMVHLARAVGHRVIVSTPERIAETMIDWFDSRACDGYNLNMPSVPEGMNAVFELLVPELQERGCFRREYVGATMRERSGLTLDDEVG